VTVGGKPLFYYPTADGVLFGGGSEPKAILAHPSVSQREQGWFRELLVLAKNPDPQSSPACASVARTGRAGEPQRVTKRRYWMLNGHEHNDDLLRTIRTVASCWKHRPAQIVADVPLCQSALRWARLLGRNGDGSPVRSPSSNGGRIRSFSVDLPVMAQPLSRATSTSPLIHRSYGICAHVGCDHTEVVLDSRELANQDLRRGRHAGSRTFRSALPGTCTPRVPAFPSRSG